MTIGIKEIIYIITYLLSVFSVYFIARNKINNLERDSKLFKKILYKERGALNLIDYDTCKKHRDEIFTALRRSEKSVEMLLLELRDIKENMIIIMVHMGIKTPNGFKKKED